ncbi:MAG: GMC family oxidoreductase [Actinomycetota bacterium]
MPSFDETRSYDYIIVGGGSAGCVLAAELSVRASVEVLLLEAGPDWRTLDAAAEVRSLNPARVIAREKFAELQWPTLTAARVDGQRERLFWRGRGLGGSSTINGVIAIRPLPDDWDRWQQPGWRHDDVLPSLRRIERDIDFGAEPYHGGDGPLPIFRMPVDLWGATDRALWDAAIEAGHQICDDHNAPAGTGVSPYAINGDPLTMERVTANDAWLEPIRDRPNLTIVGDALVDRVLFDGTRARGVRVRIGDEWTEVTAGEVVLSAGAVHSPAILLRSGIGPSSGLPVGEGLQDHANTFLLLDYRDGAGPETVDDRHTNCCVRYSSGHADAGDNDMMIVSMNHSTRRDQGGLLIGWVNQAFSTGRLSLRSDDPETHPKIDEFMLSDERDLVRLRDATRRMLSLTQTPGFEAITERVSIDLAGTDPSELDADDALDRWLLANSSDAQHICATAAMGRVVDADCRVLGYDGLRVVDASVFPEVPRANTHLMTLAVADAVAHRITGGPPNQAISRRT